jgi:hypothetical protein
MISRDAIQFHKYYAGHSCAMPICPELVVGLTTIKSTLGKTEMVTQ